MRKTIAALAALYALAGGIACAAEPSAQEQGRMLRQSKSAGDVAEAVGDARVYRAQSESPSATAGSLRKGTAEAR